MQAVRPPGFLPPLQVGLGVHVHHVIGSRKLVDILNSLVFACSYTEVQHYERSAASEQGRGLVGFNLTGFVQFAADNVDHNLQTIHGTGTFLELVMILRQKTTI